MPSSPGSETSELEEDSIPEGSISDLSPPRRAEVVQEEEEPSDLSEQVAPTKDLKVEAVDTMDSPPKTQDKSETPAKQDPPTNRRKKSLFISEEKQDERSEP